MLKKTHLSSPPKAVRETTGSLATLSYGERAKFSPPVATRAHDKEGKKTLYFPLKYGSEEDLFRDTFFLIR